MRIIDHGSTAKTARAASRGLDREPWHPSHGYSGRLDFHEELKMAEADVDRPRQGLKVSFANYSSYMVSIAHRADDPGCVLTGDGYFQGSTAGEVARRISGCRGKTERIKAVLRTLRGLWSFVYRCADGGGTLIARDRTDAKNVYYYEANNTVHVSNRLLALVKAKGGARYDLRFLNDYATGSGNCLANEYTPFEGICRLLPGSLIWLTKDGQKKLRWHDVEEVNRVEMPRSLDEKARFLRELLADAVRNCFLQADGDVGMSVSGGMDSSTLFAVAQAMPEFRDRVKMFSIRNPEPDHDESPAVADLVKMYKRNVHYVDCPLPKRDIGAHLGSFLADQEVPSHIIPTWSMALFYQKVSAFGVRSIIEGWDSGSAWASLPHMQEIAVTELLRRNDVLAAKLAWNACASSRGEKPTLSGFLRNVARSGSVPPGAELLARCLLQFRRFARKAEDVWTSGQSVRIREQRKHALRPLRGYLPLAPSAMEPDAACEAASSFLGIRAAEGGASVRVHDNAIRPTGIAYYLPFSDPRVKNFALALPPEMLVHGCSKYLLRYAMKDRLPATISKNGKKSGLRGPVNDWVNNANVRNEIAAILTDGSVASCPLARVDLFVQDFQKLGGRELSEGDVRTLFKFLSLVLWDRIIRDLQSSKGFTT